MAENEVAKAEVKEGVKAEAPAESKEEKVERKSAREDKKSVEVPKEFASLVKELDKLSALEISKFVKFLEEHWGVSASAPAVTVAAPATGGEDATPTAEEKSEYD